MIKLLLIAVIAIMSGKASFYDSGGGQRLASGLWFDGSRMEAAHKTLRFGTVVEVTK